MRQKMVNRIKKTPKNTVPMIMLDAWTDKYEVGLTTPTIFTAWLKNFMRELVVDDLGSLDLTLELMRSPWYRTGVQTFLSTDKESPLCDDIRTKKVKETCQDLLTKTLEQAIDEGAQKHKWGGVHKLKYLHKPLGMFPVIGEYFNRERAVGGTDTTLHCYAFNYAKDYTVDHGPTSKMVVDLGEVRESIMGIDTG
jgi:acyl-homoserine lactone acylase PvdQ